MPPAAPTWAGGLRAQPGDRLVISGHELGEVERDAEVLEARGAGGGAPFLVRWADSGHETLLYPGSDARIEPAAAGRSRPLPSRVPHRAHGADGTPQEGRARAGGGRTRPAPGPACGRSPPHHDQVDAGASAHSHVTGPRTPCRNTGSAPPTRDRVAVEYAATGSHSGARRPMTVEAPRGRRKAPRHHPWPVRRSGAHLALLVRRWGGTDPARRGRGLRRPPEDRHDATARSERRRGQQPAGRPRPPPPPAARSGCTASRRCGQRQRRHDRRVRARSSGRQLVRGRSAPPPPPWR